MQNYLTLLWGRKVIISLYSSTLKMEAARSSEMLVMIYQNVHSTSQKTVIFIDSAVRTLNLFLDTQASKHCLGL
jgi:hypothetical protein